MNEFKTENTYTNLKSSQLNSNDGSGSTQNILEKQQEKQRRKAIRKFESSRTLARLINPSSMVQKNLSGDNIGNSRPFFSSNPN